MTKKYGPIDMSRVYGGAEYDKAWHEDGKAAQRMYKAAEAHNAKVKAGAKFKLPEHHGHADIQRDMKEKP